MSVVDPVRFFFISNLVTMQNLVVVSHTVCAHIGGHKNWESGVRSLGIGARLTDLSYDTCFTTFAERSGSVGLLLRCPENYVAI